MLQSALHGLRFLWNFPTKVLSPSVSVASHPLSVRRREEWGFLASSLSMSWISQICIACLQTRSPPPVPLRSRPVYSAWLPPLGGSGALSCVTFAWPHANLTPRRSACWYFACWLRKVVIRRAEWVGFSVCVFSTLLSVIFRRVVINLLEIWFSNNCLARKICFV